MKKRPIRNSIQIMKKNRKQMGLIILFDALFILLVINLRFVTTKINSWILTIFSVLGGAKFSALIILIGTIEFMLLTAVYAFFKYLVLGNIQEIYKKKGLKFNRLFSFIKLNWIILIPIVIIYIMLFSIVIPYLAATIMGRSSSLFLFLSIPIIIAIALLSLTIYLYTLLNLSHNIFLREEKLKKVLKETFVKSLKLGSYKVYWPNFKILLIFGAFLLMIHILVYTLILTTIKSYLGYYGYYRIFLISSSILLGYFLLLFNRLSFFQICEKMGLVHDKKEK